MRKFINAILAISLIIAPMAEVLAADIKDLDRVSVLMPKSRVVSILGKPDQAAETGEGLKIDIYDLDNINPLVGAGYLYESESSLAGHALIFRGNVAKPTADRLMEDGFTLLEEKGAFFRLAGKDDDTGHPVVVTISENNDLTTVMTFEKGFYDRRAK